MFSRSITPSDQFQLEAPVVMWEHTFASFAPDATGASQAAGRGIATSLSRTRFRTEKHLSEGVCKL